MDIRNTITRFGATALIGCGLVVTTIPATFAQNGEETITYEYQDHATSHISEIWYEGETLKITGEGFVTQNGASGSTIAIKLNKGSIKIDGQDYLEVKADEKGNFSVSIPWQKDLDGRVSVDVYLLSGSLKDGDTSRGGKAATVKIEARSVAEATPTASASPSASASVSASPSASASASVSPSALPSASVSASPSEEVVASVDAEIKNRAEASASASETASESASAPASESASASASATDAASESASASAAPSVSPSATASADASTLVGSPKTDSAPASASASPSYKYQNCADVWADRGTSIFRGDPDFRDKFDADGDNKGCDERPGYENTRPAQDQSDSSSDSQNSAVDQLDNSATTQDSTADHTDSSSTGQEFVAAQPKAESTRFANCSEVAAAGLAPMRSDHPDFRKKFDADNDGIGCEIIDDGVSGSTSSGSGSSSRDHLGLSGSSSSSYTSSRAQRSSLANTGASSIFTMVGLGLVTVGLGVAGVTVARRRKNS